MLTTIIAGLCLATAVTAALMRWLNTRSFTRKAAQRAATVIPTAYLALWPLVVVVVIAYGIGANQDTAAERPAFLVYLAVPVILGALYRFHHWHKRHPGAISGALAGLISRAVRGGKRRRTSQKSKRQRLAEGMPAPRGYIRGLLLPWIGLVTFKDTVAWSLIHVVVLGAGAILTLNVTAETAPWYVVLGLALVLAAVSFGRWRKIDKARQKHIRAMFGTAADQFDYDKAARNTHLPDRANYESPEGTIRVTWRSMVEPETITVRFPQTWPKTDLRRRERFQADWEATFKDATVKKFLWDTGAQVVQIVPANYPENVRWDGQTVKPWHEFVVGVDLDSGEVLKFSVVKNAPHILVAGETGSGKSELMFIIVAQASLKGWTISICDPKGTGWITWTQNYRYNDQWGFQTGADPLQPGDARKGIVRHATELFGISEAVTAALAEMERRKKVNAKMRVTNSADIPDEEAAENGIQPHLVVIDEALSLFAKDKGGSEETKERNEIRMEILSNVVRMIVEARALMLHMMLGFQRPDTTYMDGSARDNTGIRMACGAMSEDGTRMVFGSTEGVPSLPLRVDGNPDEVVKGRGQARFGSGQPVQNIQYMWCGPEQADLDKHLPMPEIDPSQIVGTAPDKPHDTYIEEDADLYNPFLDADGKPVSGKKGEPADPAPEDQDTISAEDPPAPSGDDTEPETDAPAQTQDAGDQAPEADPFQAPGANPWGRATPAWPGVTTPEQGDEAPEAEAAPESASGAQSAPAEGKRPSFRDRGAPAPRRATQAEPAAAEPAEGQIVDTGTGRESYSAPVVWESGSEEQSGSIFDLGLEDDEYTDEGLAAAVAPESRPEAAGETHDAPEAETAPTPEPEAEEAATEEDSEQSAGGLSAADFAFEDGPEPEPSTGQSSGGLSAADFAFDDDEGTAPDAASEPSSGGLSAADFAFDDEEERQEATQPEPEQDAAVESPAPSRRKADSDVSSLFAPASAKADQSTSEDDWLV